MAFVPVPKDLNRVKTKVMFNLTKRQLICFSIAAAVGVPIFFLAKAHLDLSTAAMLMVVIMLPFIFFALYEKDGQPAEKYLYHIVQSMFIRDKVRPYRTNNLYAEIQQKSKNRRNCSLNNSTAKAKPKMTVKNGVVYGDALSAQERSGSSCRRKGQEGKESPQVRPADHSLCGDVPRRYLQGEQPPLHEVHRL